MYYCGEMPRINISQPKRLKELPRHCQLPGFNPAPGDVWVIGWAGFY
jgi:hypothetical protein